MAAFLSEVVLAPQRGFVRGRCITDNILELEVAGLGFAAKSTATPAMIAFDIEAAFPSIAHTYMWQVLQRYAIPMSYINILKGMYHNYRIQLRVGGRVFNGFSIQAGIKQGCPCSGSLFALGLDPFIRMVCLRIPPAVGKFLAFADDMAAAVMNIYIQFPILVKCFILLRMATALRAHAKRPNLPLWLRSTRLNFAGGFLLRETSGPMLW